MTMQQPAVTQETEEKGSETERLVADDVEIGFDDKMREKAGGGVIDTLDREAESKAATGKGGLYRGVHQDDGERDDDLLPMMQDGPHRKRRYLMLTSGFLVLVLFIVSTCYWLNPVRLFSYGNTDINVILMISDGFGPASETFARHIVENASNSPYGTTLPLDALLVGSSRTRSSDSLITDSAAGATAFACGLKTYNGAIGVEPEHVEPCGTVLESAHLSGYLTGLVATSRITHATPASFAAHVPDRDMENEIAVWLAGDGGAGAMGRTLDLAFGGGRCHFLPKSTDGSCRVDSQDIVAHAERNGFNVVLNRSAFDQVAVNKDGALPLMALFSLDHMNYEIDRSSSDEPSLEEMSIKALNALDYARQSRGKKGFFVMIEGSRIDMAGHSNDPAGHLHDILAYNKAIESVKNWIDKNDKKRTLLISVSDHETGGMALGRQLHTTYPEYQYYPDIVMNATRTSEFLSRQLLRHPDAPAAPTDEYLRSSIVGSYGISDPDDKEIRALKQNWKNAYHIDVTLADMLSRRAQIGWSTHGHSAVDVNLYAHGYQKELLRGNHDNTEIGEIIARVMDLDLTEPTRLLRETKSKWWMNSSRASNKGLLDANDGDSARLHLSHYHHDHRRRL